MDFVHIWYDDRYSSKVLLSNTHAYDLKSSYFPNHTIDLIYTWNDYRYRSKVFFIITFTHAYELKVKVTFLSIGTGRPRQTVQT